MTAPCLQCGVDFQFISTTRPKSFCSARCRRACAKSQPGYAEQTRERKARRRAQKAAAPTETFAHRDVFERDKWRCQLCGKPTFRSKRPPHPRAPTLDHVIPLAKGGSHTKANTQCACFRCNCLKGDRLLNPEQLRLIG